MGKLRTVDLLYKPLLQTGGLFGVTFQWKSSVIMSFSIFSVADSLASFLMAALQTLFFNWFAYQKRSTTEVHLRLKPGRQVIDGWMDGWMSQCVSQSVSQSVDQSVSEKLSERVK